MHESNNWKGSNWDALPVEVRPTLRLSSWTVFGQICTANAQTLLFPRF